MSIGNRMTALRWIGTAVSVLALAFAFVPEAARAQDFDPLKPFLVRDADARKCQTAISIGTFQYAGKKLKAIQRCLDRIQKGVLVGDPTTLCRGSLVSEVHIPPTDPATAAQLVRAESLLRGRIATRCSDVSVAALSVCGSTVSEVSDCLVLEYWERIQDLLDAQYGVAAPVASSGARRCQTAIARAGASFARRQQRGAQRCLNRRNKTCGTGDGAAQCIGALAAGTPVLPTNSIMSRTIARGVERMERSIVRACSGADLAALDACSTDPASLADCLVSSHWTAIASALGEEFGGAEIFANPAITLQAAVDAAGPGDTILMDVGEYLEEVEANVPGLRIIGQKDCNGNRPALVNPGGADNGIASCGSLASDCGASSHWEPSDPNLVGLADGILFESIEARDYAENGVFTIGTDGVTFRDIVAIGPGTSVGMEYGIFPVLSNDVLIEDSLVIGVRDAAIYVGQSTNIIVRNNEVFGNVAGIEIENSANADVFGNFVHDNTGGILVFKLPGLPVQLSNCHDIHDNVIVNNNTPNFGSGIVGLVPRGTGILTVSTDTTIIRDNLITGNESLGLAVTDQDILDLLFGAFGGMLSADFISADNFFFDNEVTGNGLSPDPLIDFFGLASDAVNLVSAGVPGCQSGNVVDVEIDFAALPTCVLPATPPGCPIP